MSVGVERLIATSRCQLALKPRGLGQSIRKGKWILQHASRTPIMLPAEQTARIVRQDKYPQAGLMLEYLVGTYLGLRHFGG